MNIIQKNIHDLKDIINIFTVYYNKLEPLLEQNFYKESIQIKKIIDYYPNEYNKLEEDTKLLNETLNKHVSFKENIDIIFTVYSSFQNIQISIKNLKKYFEEPFMEPDNIDISILSQTYKLETSEYLNKIKLEHDNFMKKYILDNEHIINELSSIILNIIDDKMENVEYLQIVFHKNKNTVELYSNILQKFIDNILSVEGKKLTFKILSMIEDDKNMFLSGNIINSIETPDKKIHIINPPLKKFGLIPVTDSVPIDKLLIILLEGKVSGKIDINNYTKKENCCFIFINRVTYHPMEYNIRQLIMKDASEQFIQSNSFGITKKIIDRFKTIKKGDISKVKWDFSYKTIGNIDSSNIFYVIETLDGKNYRALAPWLIPKNLGLPKYRVNTLLKHITKHNQPDRVSNYHNICIKRAIPNMFIQKKLPVEYIEEYARSIDTTIIKNKLFLNIKNVIENEIISNEYKKGKLIKSNVDINNIIHDNRLRNIFNNVMFSMYSIGSKSVNSKYTAGKFPFSEILSSYIVSLTALTNRFMKELHDGYNRNPLSDKIFLKPVNDIFKIIIEKIENILSSTIETLINNNDNIYNTYNFKYKLLNFQ